MLWDCNSDVRNLAHGVAPERPELGAGSQGRAQDGMWAWGGLARIMAVVMPDQCPQGPVLRDICCLCKYIAMINLSR